MFSRLNRLVRNFFRRSRTINNEPLNKVSLIVIVLIDMFILANVFVGLDDISQWHISPSSEYPCYQTWDTYRKDTKDDRDFEIIRQAADPNALKLGEQYPQAIVDHLGKVNNSCLQYASTQDAIKQPDNAAILQGLADKQAEIESLQAKNNTIRSQYDSTLLEKIADQPREQSINNVEAAQAKQNLDQNNTQINTLKAEISTLKSTLISKPTSVAFLDFLKQDSTFGKIEQGYNQAQFWYPSLQLAFQALFLTPLLFVAFVIHARSQRSRHGLIALMSWHLLVIFSIPLVLKIFEFLQVGILFEFIFDLIQVLFGSLLFLVSYVYILLIPLIGVGLIKLFQYFIFNPEIQATNRVQKSQCIQCAKKLASHDSHCPHCGYGQYQGCSSCHQPTYKYLSYCKECGAVQAK